MFTTKKLSNGLRILFAPLHDTDAVTVLAMTKVGSRYETARNNGVSHFLEHMMFKGTDKRLTALDVTKELDGVGASFNAFTGKDYTGYYVKLSKEHLPLALDIIADMLWHSKFAQAEIEKERHVIIEEINMYYDNPIMYIDELFEQRLFGRAHPLGRLIAGPREVIRSLNRDDLVRYFRQHYFPNNMVLCVAGSFRPASVLRTINALFGAMHDKRRPTGHQSYRHHQQRVQLDIHFRETEQVQLALGYPALPYGHKDLPALSLLATILGGNMSSRLFTRVREQEGLAYSIHASRASYRDTGTFMVQAGLDKQRVMPALTLILQELQTVQEHGVTADELTHAKEFIKGKLTLELEDSEHLANFFTSQELLTNRIRTPEQRFAEIRRVQREDVQRVAAAIFKPKLLNLALIGPFREKRQFLKAIHRAR